MNKFKRLTATALALFTIFILPLNAFAATDGTPDAAVQDGTLAPVETATPEQTTVPETPPAPTPEQTPQPELPPELEPTPQPELPPEPEPTPQPEPTQTPISTETQEPSITETSAPESTQTPEPTEIPTPEPSEPIEAELVSGDFEYTLNDDGTVTITKYTNTAATVTVPEMIDGKIVSALKGSPDTYSGVFNNNITNVILPDSLKTIGEYAFYGCSNLTNVTIPNSITEIGFNAFAGCGSLTSVTIPDKVTSIGLGAFGSCTNLTSITIPNSVNLIYNFAVKDCPKVIIKCYKDSAAYKYAQANKIKVWLLDAPNPPNAPTKPTLTPGNGQITAKWNAAANAQVYEVFLSTSLSSVGSLCKRVNSKTRSVSIPNLLAGTKYYVRVRAYRTVEGRKYYSDYSASNYAVPKLANVKTFKATAAGFDRAALTWSKADGARGYKITYSKDKKNYYPCATVNGASTVSYTATKLTPNATYYFKIQPYGGTVEGNLKVSNAVKIIGGAPSNFKADVKSPTVIAISWKAVPGATGYDIWRQIGTGKSSIVKTNSASTLYFNDTKVTPGTSYKYTIRAFVKVGINKYYSGAATSKYAKPTIATPTKLTATIKSPTSVYMSWGAVSGVSGYEVWRKVNNGKPALVKALPASTHSFSNTSLAPDTNYGYTVRAYVTVGKLKYYSGWTTAKTLKPTIATPTNFTATLKSLTNTYMTWDSVPYAAGYEVWRSEGSGKPELVKTNSASSQSFADTKVVPKTTYNYTVRAYVTVGKSKYYSGWTTAKTLKTTIATPTNFTVTVKSPTSATMTWDEVPYAMGYEVWRQTESDKPELIKTNSASSRSFTDTKLVPDMTYNYMVRAFVTIGESKYNGEYAAYRNVIPIVGTPSNFAATATGPTSAHISWNAVNGASGYELHRSENGGKYEKIQPTDMLSHTEIDLTRETSYSYMVRAYIEIGEKKYYGSWSTKVSITTPPLVVVSYEYTVNSDKETVTIIKYSDTGAPNLTIPATIENKTVTDIDPEAFKGNYSITSVTIPSGVISIGSYAFANCINLTSITIPASVTSIGNYVFKNCPNIEISCYENSKAYTYAVDNKINYKLL